jgi:hypothetical protein
MSPEGEEIQLDGMKVHPDWNKIETLTIHPDCDTLVIVPGHALFKSSTKTDQAGFDPFNVAFWSLNEFQDVYELRLLIEHIHMGVLTTARIPHSIVVFSGGCSRKEAEGWTEGSSYYEVADYFDWWQSESGVPLYLMKAKTFVDVYAFDSMDNLWMSIKLFQMAHPRKEVPKRVIVVGYAFKKRRFEMHAQVLGIPVFEYMGMEDPVNFSVDPGAVAREEGIIACYHDDPFAEDFNSVVGKKKMKRNFLGEDYPYGTAREVQAAYKKQFQRRKAETGSSIHRRERGQ